MSQSLPSTADCIRRATAVEASGRDEDDGWDDETNNSSYPVVDIRDGGQFDEHDGVLYDGRDGDSMRRAEHKL